MSSTGGLSFLIAVQIIHIVCRSGSMTLTDRQPLRINPAWNLISRAANNRLGAVYSALHSFWSARATAASQSSTSSRRHAYSAILFNHSPTEVLNNDLSRNADQLLASPPAHTGDGGTNFNKALTTTEQVMERYWSTERYEHASSLVCDANKNRRSPVVIFLSDGKCSV